MHARKQRNDGGKLAVVSWKNPWETNTSIYVREKEKERLVNYSFSSLTPAKKKDIYLFLRANLPQGVQPFNVKEKEKINKQKNDAVKSKQ